MRPRHKAAENGGAPGLRRRPGRGASMRPRHKAAENATGVDTAASSPPRCFNEAAA